MQMNVETNVCFYQIIESLLFVRVVEKKMDVLWLDTAKICIGNILTHLS
jgi:hypothetical protein